MINFNYVVTTINANYFLNKNYWLNYVIKDNHVLTTKTWLKKWLKVLYNRPRRCENLF